MQNWEYQFKYELSSWLLLWTRILSCWRPSEGPCKMSFRTFQSRKERGEYLSASFLPSLVKGFLWSWKDSENRKPIIFKRTITVMIVVMLILWYPISSLLLTVFQALYKAFAHIFSLGPCDDQLWCISFTRPWIYLAKHNPGCIYKGVSALD